MKPEIIKSSRLIIRPFVADDLPVIHRILEQTFGDGSLIDAETALQERRSWLQWSILNQKWLPAMHQPPYGDRAIVLKASGTLIGTVGFVPCLNLFAQIPELGFSAQDKDYNLPEVGLFWAIDPAYQNKGYATEAAQAMIAYAFEKMRLKQIIATTEYDNLASQRVMQKAGMTLSRNPQPEPPWLQVVGICYNQD